MTLAPPKPEMAKEGHDTTNTSVEATMKIPKTWWSTPDSVALNPVSGRSHSKETKVVHPIWTEYSIGLARFMAPLTSLPIIPTEIAGVFKHADKLNTEHKGKEPPSEDDDESCPPNTGEQKKFPPEVKTVNMIYDTHIPKREHKCALMDIYAREPVASKFNPWSAYPFTFDRRDHSTSIRHGGSAALVLDPIID